jgi:hypothetical protein
MAPFVFSINSTFSIITIFQLMFSTFFQLLFDSSGLLATLVCVSLAESFLSHPSIPTKLNTQFSFNSSPPPSFMLSTIIISRRACCLHPLTASHAAFAASARHSASFQQHPDTEGRILRICFCQAQLPTPTIPLFSHPLPTFPILQRCYGA